MIRINVDRAPNQIGPRLRDCENNRQELSLGNGVVALRGAEPATEELHGVQFPLAIPLTEDGPDSNVRSISLQNQRSGGSVIEEGKGGLGSLGERQLDGIEGVQMSRRPQLRK